MFAFVFISLTFSSLWWVRAPGVKCCRILRDSTSVSCCHSFLTTMLQSRTAPSVTSSTTETLTSGIPFILHKNNSEVIPLALHLFTHQHITISCWALITTLINPDGYFNPEVVKYRQLCAKSQKKRQLYSLQQYYHRLLKHILVSRKVIFVKVWRKIPQLPRAIRLNVSYFFLGAARFCGSQWTGLSPEKKVNDQDSCWNAWAAGTKKIEPHIKGGQNWVWRQRCFIRWWRSVCFFFCHYYCR